MSEATINIKINSIKIDHDEYLINFTTIVKNLPLIEEQKSLGTVEENRMEFNENDDAFKAYIDSPDKSDESKDTLWGKLKTSFIKKVQTQKLPKEASENDSKSNNESVMKKKTFDLSFPGVQRTSSEIEQWLGYLELNQTEIQDCFRTQNTA